MLLGGHAPTKNSRLILLIGVFLFATGLGLVTMSSISRHGVLVGVTRRHIRPIATMMPGERPDKNRGLLARGSVRPPTPLKAGGRATKGIVFEHR